MHGMPTPGSFLQLRDGAKARNGAVRRPRRLDEPVAGTDPEVVRRRVNEFFETVSSCVAQHGGLVEQFAGDAVLAAFGVPQAHEDDALAPPRGARDARLGRRLGLQARVGIEAGWLVVESAESTFATGEAVNLAARLQQVARGRGDPRRPDGYRLAAKPRGRGRGAPRAYKSASRSARGASSPLSTAPAASSGRVRRSSVVSRLELLENTP